ncbi:MAG: response regulator [Gaiellaceae bacterium]
MRPTVLIADDHTALRRGVRIALERGGFSVVAEAADAPTAVEEAVKRRPDVCLLDVRMPGGGGIYAAGAITAQVPSTTVVMLTVMADDSYLFSALEAGAAGYMLKETDPNRLVQTLGGVLRGEAALPRTLVARLISEFRLRESRDGRRRALESDAGTTLTNREWEVLRLLGEGRKTAEIAEVLGVTPVTVRSHVAMVLAKLRVADRGAAVRRLQELPDV